MFKELRELSIKLYYTEDLQESLCQKVSQYLLSIYPKRLSLF